MYYKNAYGTNYIRSFAEIQTLHGVFALVARKRSDQRSPGRDQLVSFYLDDRCEIIKEISQAREKTRPCKEVLTYKRTTHIIPFVEEESYGKR